MKRKQTITERDYIKANRKASREEEISAHGRPVSQRPKVHRSDAEYDRRRQKSDLSDKLADLTVDKNK